MDDAQLPDDPAFREAMNAYMRWAVDAVALAHPDGADGIAPERGDAALGLGRSAALSAAVDALVEVGGERRVLVDRQRLGLHSRRPARG